MAAKSRRFELTLLPERYAISRLAPMAPIPGWAMQGVFSSITRTQDELSVVCELARVPSGAQSQPSWSILRVHGPFAMTEIGVLSALASLLVEAKLSLFAISTFDTGYLLVASETLSAAVGALERAVRKIHRSQTA